MKLILYEKIDLILGILAWGLIGFVIFIVLLKLLGVIHSPLPFTLENLFAAGILLELVKVETKFGKTEEKINLLWSDFKIRKKL